MKTSGKIVKEGVPGSSRLAKLSTSRVGGGSKKGGSMGMGKAGPLVTTNAKDPTLMKRK